MVHGGAGLELREEEVEADEAGAGGGQQARLPRTVQQGAVVFSVPGLQ